MTTAFDSYDLAGTLLANRIVMAPMTRNRADAATGVPTAIMADYYAQRASAGLIVTEGIQPSPLGQGYPSTPGLHSGEQVEGWREVTRRVHAAGGRIFAQLMHAGRISHPSVLPGGEHPVAPSAVRPAGQLFTGDGMRDFETPRELTEAEIERTVAEFAAAARNAIDAGFDGVELHGANGYLLHQFLATGSNRRDDGWGGSVEGRIRMVTETVRAVSAEIGAHRTGLRISPGNPFNDITEDGIEETYPALLEALAPVGLAYLHVMENDDHGFTHRLRKVWPGTFMLNPHTPGGTTSRDDLTVVEDGTADLVSFGTLFLANPDLPARLAAGGPYNDADASTFYGGDHRGYTDYPALV